MNTLILQAPGAMTAPLPGTPTIPDLTRGVLFDFNADTLSLTDGANVTSWKNGGGSWGSKADFKFASSNPPKFSSAGVTPGHGSVKFTTSPATYLITDSAISPKIATPITTVVLVKFAAAADGSKFENIFSGRSSNAGEYVYVRRNPTGRLSIGGGVADQIVPAEVVSGGSWKVITAVFDGASSKLFIDGAKYTGICSAATLDGLTLGANAILANNLNGDVAAFKAFSRALSDEEVTLQRQALLLAHGLS